MPLADTESTVTTAEVIAGLVGQGLVTPPESARGRLLRAATELFRRQGYERTTVRDLAREIGIQSGSIFHHFRSKADILRTVMEENIRISIARMEAAAAGLSDPRAVMGALIHAELESINGDSADALNVLVFEWRCLAPESQQELLELRNEYEAVFIRALAGLRPDLPAEELWVLRRLMAGSVSWTYTWYRPDGPLNLAALSERILQMVAPSAA